MNESNSTMMNIGDLAKPATTLIEKIADATGAIFLPYQIKRVARAEAEASKIKAMAEREIAEINEIQQRALAWTIGELTKYQENRENVLIGAFSELEEDAKPERIDSDWLLSFFEKCKLVSDSEMQSLWSKILASEANAPGSFSKRTIELVSTLDKSDAQLFTNLCGFCWIIDKEVKPLIYFENDLDTDHKREIYTRKFLTFNNIDHLETIGLVKFSGTFSTYTNEGLPKLISASYFDKQLNIEFDRAENNSMEVGSVILTQVGRELYPICGAKEVEGFLEFVLERWSYPRYTISSPYPNHRQ